MKREQIAALVTVVVILAVVTVIAVREGGGGSTPSRPTDEAVKPSRVVFGLFQFATAGDTDGYLACFDRALRESMEATVEEIGDAAFETQIRDIGEAVKGVSVSEIRSNRRDAQLRVELVYADRTMNDLQTFTVRRSGEGWLIVSMSRAETIEMPIPYGTPAYPLEMDVTETPDVPE